MMKNRRGLLSLCAVLLAATLNAPAHAADCHGAVPCGGTVPCDVTTACDVTALCDVSDICGGRFTRNVTTICGVPFPCNMIPFCGGTVPRTDTTQNPGTAPETPADTSQNAASPQTEPPQRDSGAHSYETEVVRLVNEVRAAYGLNPLEEDGDLSRVARYKSQDMRDKGYFDHTSPTYGTPFQMMKSFGISYRTAGENIAYGYRTPEAVMEGWMNSSGHRANILNASYTKIGVGYVADGNYWTQLFTG